MEVGSPRRLHLNPNYLIVRFSAIGDCVMTSWAATAIRRSAPSARIVWAVESRCSSIIEPVSLVTDIHDFPRDRWKASRWSPATWREQVLRYLGLRQFRFDVGIDFQGHSKTALCLRLAAPKERIAARATDSFAHRLNPTLKEPSDMHIVDWNHEVLGRFGDFEIPTRPIMPHCEATKRASVVTIMVGAGSPDKAYPREGWRAVAAGLRARGFRIHVLGGPTDESLGDECLDLVGKLSLRETMEQVASSALHLAADTGTGHIAAAYGVPSVSVMGPMPPAKYRPYSANATVLWSSPDPASVSPEEILDAALKRVEVGLSA